MILVDMDTTLLYFIIVLLITLTICLCACGCFCLHRRYYKKRSGILDIQQNYQTVENGDRKSKTFSNEVIHYEKISDKKHISSDGVYKKVSEKKVSDFSERKQGFCNEAFSTNLEDKIYVKERLETKDDKLSKEDKESKVNLELKSEIADHESLAFKKEEQSQISAPEITLAVSNTKLEEGVQGRINDPSTAEIVATDKSKDNYKFIEDDKCLKVTKQSEEDNNTARELEKRTNISEQYNAEKMSDKDEGSKTTKRQSYEEKFDDHFNTKENIAFGKEVLPTTKKDAEENSFKEITDLGEQEYLSDEYVIEDTLPTEDYENLSFIAEGEMNFDSLIEEISSKEMPTDIMDDQTVPNRSSSVKLRTLQRLDTESILVAAESLEEVIEKDIRQSIEKDFQESIDESEEVFEESSPEDVVNENKSSEGEDKRKDSFGQFLSLVRLDSFLNEPGSPQAVESPGPSFLTSDDTADSKNEQDETIPKI